MGEGINFLTEGIKLVRFFDWEGVSFLIGNVVILYLLCEDGVFDWYGTRRGNRRAHFLFGGS